ncbi:MAG TPA: hypothetical protein DC054_22970 [Blastocatellia bacterium]|nr:hypothetical protein [Blastocatellia bacterium]
MCKVPSKLVCFLAALLLLASAKVSFCQNAPTDVHAKLTLADAKTTYRIGEPIVVILEFTADRDGYQADITADKSDTRVDEVYVSPESGVYHWRKESLGGGYRDYSSIAKLSTSPARVQFQLNDSLRFDKPGRYSVRFITHRVSPNRTAEYQPAIPLTTNEISFDVEQMSAVDEEKEVKRISDLIDAAHDWQTQDKYGRELSFLTGDASAREKVRRFSKAEGVIPGNYFGEIYDGLFIARNRALVLQLLEAAMRDPNTPVTSGLLGVITHLRFLQQYGDGVKQPAGSFVLEPNGDPRSREIQDAYVSELAAGLAKRTGKSQTTTAMTILTHLPEEPQAKGALLREVRRLLVQQFDSLHPFDQEYLLRQYWDQLRDASLIPSLKKMLSSTGMASKNIHDSALKRLIEIVPEEARPFVVSEIRDPTSLVDLEVLGNLADKSLPEVDAALLEQIRRLASSQINFDRVYLKHKASLAARYGTDAIYQDLLEVYRNSGAKLPIDSRACLLAYFARYNEQETLPLIEQTLTETPPGQEFNFLPELTRLYYSDGIDALLRKRLESNEPQIVSNAAYLISLHGSADDEKVLESRLDRWRKDWANRSVEAETNLQGTVERELVYGLIHAKAWKLAPDRMKELQQGCITKYCSQNFPK